jgi:hypothetical protein
MVLPGLAAAASSSMAKLLLLLLLVMLSGSACLRYAASAALVGANTATGMPARARILCMNGLAAARRAKPLCRHNTQGGMAYDHQNMCIVEQKDE